MTREQIDKDMDTVASWVPRHWTGAEMESASKEDLAVVNRLRSYLAQPEGGDVEEALGAVDALDDIVVEAIYDLVDDGQSGKSPKDYSRDWATIRSALRSAKEREAAAVGEWRTCDTCGKKAPPEFIEPDEGDIWMCHTCCWTWVSTNACYWENGRPLNGVDSAVAAAVERTVEKAKAIMRGYESVWIPEILAALDSLKETP